MIKKLKLCIFLMPLLFTAFYSGDRGLTIENYNNLHSLKSPMAPAEIKMIKTENLGNSRSVIEKGVLLTYKNRYAKKVKIAGDFSNWQTVDMYRSKYGIWYYFLTDLSEDKITRYKFVSDGVWILDPMNIERIDDGSGSYMSVLQPASANDTAKLTLRFINRNEVEFRLYRPKAKFISLVGDFNNWNPENDVLEKDKNGIWTLRKKLIPGLYKYKYIIDGNWTLDIYNERTSGDAAEGITSLLKVEK
jgi:1,4-alpha-glucan branching enzyme